MIRKCKGCGEKKKIWAWFRCYECAMDYEKEMEDQVRMSGFGDTGKRQEAQSSGW